LLLLLLIAVFPLYYELGRIPVQLWDESRLAVNAAEMAQSGHWLVPKFDGSPDHWNTKPPLLIWLQAACFTLFGYSTWALRLPTLLATLGTVLLLFRFAARELGRPLAGLFGAIILVTTTGYVRLHVARTGDYDALLTFWQVLLWVNFFKYLERGHRRHLVGLALAVLAASLTKGPAGLLGLPGLLMYAVGRGKLWWLLRQSGVYVAAGGWLVLMASYFLLRESVDPGYWEAVQQNDLGGRFLQVLEQHKAPWNFYLDNLTNIYFKTWLWAVIPALLAGWLQPAVPVRRAMTMLVLFVVGWLVVISSAQTKLFWYDAPIYPALALLLGLGLGSIYQDLLGLYLPRISRRQRWFVQAVFVASVLYPAYYVVVRQMVEQRHSNYGDGNNGYLGSYITTLQRDLPQVEKPVLLTDGNYYSVLQYYKIEFQQNTGTPLVVGSNKNVPQLQPGNTVIFCEPACRASLDSIFQVVDLHLDSPCQTVLLLNRRTKP
jgi:4-amino-4-deoxy-L-arabinose transferase-like glycosyltransferase